MCASDACSTWLRTAVCTCYALCALACPCACSVAYVQEEQASKTTGEQVCAEDLRVMIENQHIMCDDAPAEDTE